MNGTNLFKIAFRALADNKLRAFLTMLRHHHRSGVRHHDARYRTGFKKKHSGANLLNGLEYDNDSSGSGYARRRPPRPQRHGRRVSSPTTRHCATLKRLPGCRQPQRILIGTAYCRQ